MDWGKLFDIGEIKQDWKSYSTDAIKLIPPEHQETIKLHKERQDLASRRFALRAILLFILFAIIIGIIKVI